MDAIKTRQILISGFLLWLFSVVGTTLVAVTWQTTESRIAANEKQVLLRNLHALLPPQRMDNDIVKDSLLLPPSPLLGTDRKTLAYRARKHNQPVAVVLNAIAPDGYNGKIYLLIGIYVDGTIAGVRVVKHNETPGLGDGIELKKSNWILGFNGKSLTHPARRQWKVKRDGGDFDQMTGATITPRAVVKAVKHALAYYQQNHQRLWQ